MFCDLHSSTRYTQNNVKTITNNINYNNNNIKNYSYNRNYREHQGNDILFFRESSPILKHSRNELVTLQPFTLCLVLSWHGGAISRTSDLPFIGRGLSPVSAALHSGLGQAPYTCVPLSSYNVVPVKGR